MVWASRSCRDSVREDLGVNHQLVAAHFGVGIAIGILIDELDHHVVVRAGGRGEDVGQDFAGEDEVFFEDREFEDGEVFAIGDEALIFSEPVEPLRALTVSGLDGAMAVGDGVGGVAHVGGFCGGLRVVEAKQTGAEQMKASGLRLFRREVGVALPGVGAGLEAGCVFEVETGWVFAGLIFEVVGEESGFNLGAVLVADGPGVVEVAEMA